MAVTHKLDAARHRDFLAQGRHNAITQASLRAGDEIVVCANPLCGAAMSPSAWASNGNRCLIPHCLGTETLAELPTSQETATFRSGGHASGQTGRSGGSGTSTWRPDARRPANASTAARPGSAPGATDTFDWRPFRPVAFLAAALVVGLIIYNAVPNRSTTRVTQPTGAVSTPTPPPPTPTPTTQPVSTAPASPTESTQTDRTEPAPLVPAPTTPLADLPRPDPRGAADRSTQPQALVPDNRGSAQAGTVAVQLAEEVEVTLDGTSLGRSDSFRTEAGPGAHRLEFLGDGIFIPGRDVQVRAGQTETVVVGALARVRLIGRPDDGQVWVAGRRVGGTPMWFKAPEGPYQLEFRWPDGRTLRYPLDLRSGMGPVAVSAPPRAPSPIGGVR